MAAPSYVSLDQFMASQTLTGFTFIEADATQALASASRAVDAICGRRFYLLDDSNDQVRYYTPLRPATLEIDDLAAEPTSVMSDQDGDGVFETTWTLHTDYELAPDNAITDGVPYERIVLKQRTQTTLPVGLPRSVQVTGIFGWSETPDGVVSLTSLLATRLLARRQAPFGVVSLGVESATRIAKEDPDMLNLVRDLIRTPIFVG